MLSSVAEEQKRRDEATGEKKVYLVYQHYLNIRHAQVKLVVKFGVCCIRLLSSLLGLLAVALLHFVWLNAARLLFLTFLRALSSFGESCFLWGILWRGRA